jgi:hypothetical protein
MIFDDARPNVGQNNFCMRRRPGEPADTRFSSAAAAANASAQRRCACE